MRSPVSWPFPLALCAALCACAPASDRSAGPAFLQVGQQWEVTTGFDDRTAWSLPLDFKQGTGTVTDPVVFAPIDSYTEGRDGLVRLRTLLWSSDGHTQVLIASRTVGRVASQPSDREVLFDATDPAFKLSMCVVTMPADATPPDPIEGIVLSNLRADRASDIMYEAWRRVEGATSENRPACTIVLKQEAPPRPALDAPSARERRASVR